MTDKGTKKKTRQNMKRIIRTKQDTEEGGASDILKKEEAEAGDKHRIYRRRLRRTLISTICIILVVAALATLISIVFLPVLRVSGDGMEETLSDGDIIVLIRTDDIKAGDVVAFYYQNKLLLKRVIGEPGDIIDMDEEGHVTVNGTALAEPYITEGSLGTTDITYPYEVPEDHYFVMGDNRSESIDSRRSDIGCMDADQLLGRAILKVWPLSEMSRL